MTYLMNIPAHSLEYKPTAQLFSESASNTGITLPPDTALSPKDRALFVEFGAGREAAPRYATLAHAFAAQVNAQPGAIAAEYTGTRITYGALDLAATKLAHTLQKQGVKRGDTVCLYLERSISMLIGMLAVVKLGASYAPQHFGVATETVLRHVAAKTSARVILTLEKMVPHIPCADGQTVIAIDGPDTGTDTTALPIVSQPKDVCMMLFTSGTTGVPNGVQVTHSNLVNILLTSPGDMGITSGTKVGQILSIAFDMAAWEIWGCLANGGTLIIRGKDIQETAEKVDVLIATPSILGGLDAQRCTAIKAVAVAGEPCPRPLADRWANICAFHNSCGPTETTIVNTLARHSATKEHLSIGRPTPNNTVYILDENMAPLPIGETGEMWAGGDCVTAGYLANDALNAERYRPDPFLGGGRMMFRTRDLGQWTKTGELLHFGRVDDQVKVRGFRVELDGISSTLESAQNCERAVALKYDNRTIIAFVSPATVDTDEAISRAKTKLPYYCVPQHVFALESLPRTSRGKIDKSVLLELSKKMIEEQEVAL